MEEYISGFIESHNNLSIINIIRVLNQKYSVVIDTIEKLGAHNQLNLYPENCLPKDNFFAFCIGDSDDYIPYESSLIDNVDWAPEADFSLPKKANDRIDLLVNILIDMVLQSNATRMVLALYDYSLFDKFKLVKNIKFNQLSDVIFQDIKLNDGPPNILYDISIDSH